MSTTFVSRNLQLWSSYNGFYKSYELTWRSQIIVAALAAALAFRFFEPGHVRLLNMHVIHNDHSGPTYMTDFPIILMAWTPVKVFKQYIHFASFMSVSTNVYNCIPFSWSYLTANVLLTHHGICYNTLTHSRLFMSLNLQKLYLLCSQWMNFRVFF